MQRFGDEFFGGAGAVGVGGVYEVHAEFDGTAQNRKRGGLIRGHPPHTFAGDTHGAVAKAVDGEIAAEVEGAGS